MHLSEYLDRVPHHRREAFVSVGPARTNVETYAPSRDQSRFMIATPGGTRRFRTVDGIFPREEKPIGA